MVKPKDGATRIRITESPGAAPVVTIFGMLMGGGALGVALVGIISAAGGSPLLTPGTAGLAFGASYLASRTAFRSFMKRRIRIMTDLMNRLTRHVAQTQPALPASEQSVDSTE
jgi:hypothetical protein